MNKKDLFILLFALLLFPLSGNAQLVNGICGTDHRELITERLLRNKQAIDRGQVKPRGAIKYIPIQIHIVRKADGSGGVSLFQVLEQIDELNSDFMDSEFQFYLKDDFNYIDHNTIYDSQVNFASLSTMQSNKANNAINIFLVNKAKHASASDDVVILGYYSPFNDWLVIRNDNIKRRSGTLSHELGHFFSLNHTHEGWDSKSWNHDSPSPLQVGTLSPGNVPTEKQDGSNCQTAGDFICDTPPDYNFGFGWIKNGDRCAEYDAGVKDPNGVVVDPMENNYMGYFISCNDYEFTSGQIEVMQADYNSGQRNYIRSSFIPNLNEVTAKPTLISPINDAVTDGYNRVDLNWDAVGEADRYLVQIDRLPDFTFDLREQVVFGTSASFYDLDPNKFYYWRVKPFNEYDTNGSFSNDDRFKTGSGTVSTNHIEGVNNWYINPNPVRANQQLELILDSEISFAAEVKIYNMNGQQVQAIPQQAFGTGRNTLNIEARDLASGIYIVTLQSDKAIMNRKLIVQ